MATKRELTPKRVTAITAPMLPDEWYLLLYGLPVEEYGDLATARAHFDFLTRTGQLRQSARQAELRPDIWWATSPGIPRELREPIGLPVVEIDSNGQHRPDRRQADLERRRRAWVLAHPEESR